MIQPGRTTPATADIFGQATEHIHTISNPLSGVTDPGPDGHVHALIVGCSACQKIRTALRVETLPTSFVRGHLHFFNSASLRN